MRTILPTIVMLIILGFGPMVLDRYMSGAPEIVWQIVLMLVAVALAGFVILSDPVREFVGNPFENLGRSCYVLAATSLFLIGVWWWVFVGQTTEAQLGISAAYRKAVYPPKTVRAGIEWRPPYGELDITISNPNNFPLDNIALELRPDQPITSVGQQTTLDGIRIEPIGTTVVTMEYHKPDGTRYGIPVELIATTGGYKVNCARLPANDFFIVKMASVNMPPGDEPIQNIFDKSYSIRFGVGNASNWYGYPDRPDSAFAQTIPVTKVLVEGGFIAKKTEHTVSTAINAEDLFSKAAELAREQTERNGNRQIPKP